MIGFGFGEFLIVLVLCLVFLDAKQIAQALRWIGKWRGKFYRIQSDIRQQLDALVEDDNSQAKESSYSSKYEMRRWGSEQAIQLPSVDKAKAAEKVKAKLENWDTFKNVQTVGCYSSLADELDTQAICRLILSLNKTLLLPLIKGDTMKMCKIEDIENDLEEGVYGIQEPSAEASQKAFPKPDLILIPGRCFDSQGYRIGRGKGYYDRYLAENKAIRVGIAFDGQVTSKKLNLPAYDIPMDYLLTEKRLVSCQKTEEHD